MKPILISILAFLLFAGNLTSASAGSISGTLHLPEGYQASEDIRLSLVIKNSVASNVNRTLTIPAGVPSVDFVFSDLIENEGTNNIRHFCGCNEEFISIGYFGIGGTVSTDTEAIAFNAFENHDNVDLYLTLGTSITVTVTLPDGYPPLTEDSIPVRVTMAYDSFIKRETVEIPVGQTSVTHSFYGFGPDPTASTHAYYECFTRCEDWIDIATYGEQEMVPAGVSSKKLATTENHNIILTLVPSGSVSGTISLPDDYNVGNSPNYLIKVFTTSSEWVFEDGTPYSQTLVKRGTLDEIAREIHYEVKGVFQSQGGMIIDYKCFTAGCDGAYFADAFYSDTGSTLLKENATLVNLDEDQIQIDFNLIRKNDISGTITTPGGIPAEQSISLIVYANFRKHSDPDYNARTSRSVSIEAGQTSVDFFFSGITPNANDDNYIIVSYENHSIGFTPTAYHNSAGTVKSITEATQLSVAVSHANIDLAVIKTIPHTVSGKIVLPENVVTTKDIYAQVGLTARGFKTGSIFIPAGATEATFEFTNLLSSSETSYVLSFDLGDEVGNIISEFFQGDSGIVRSSEDATTYVAEQDHVGIVVELKEGVKVSGAISLGGDLISEFGTSGRVEVYSFDAEGTQIDWKFVPYAIDSNGGSSIYTVQGLWPNDDGYYEVGYSCSFNCRFYEGSAWVTITGMGPPEERASITPTNPVTNVDLFLVETHTNVVAGVLKWPGNYINEQDVKVRITFDVTVPAGQGVVSLERFDKLFTLPSGANQLPFSVNLRTPTEGGELTISYRCDPCASGLTGPYYNAGPDQFTFNEDEKTSLVASQDHNLILGLSRGSVFQGVVVFSESLERISQGYSRIEITQFSSSGADIGTIGKNHFIPADENTVFFDMSGLGYSPGGYYTVHYYSTWSTAAPAPGGFDEIDGYYLDQYETTSSLAAAKHFDATSISSYSSINFAVGPLDGIDEDGDGIFQTDNCPNVYNPDQANLDYDSLGDVCDPDMDGDGVDDAIDPFPRDRYLCGDSNFDGIDDCFREPDESVCFPVAIKTTVKPTITLVCL